MPMLERRTPEREVRFDPDLDRRVVSLSNIHLPLPPHTHTNLLVIPRKRWFRPNITEKSLTGT